MTRSSSFSLEEHRTRMDQIWMDYAEYRRILADLEKRIGALEKEEEIET